MNNHLDRIPNASAATLAIMAVERQREERIRDGGPEQMERCKRFSKLLDNYDEQIFSGIVDARNKGHRRFMPGTLPEFKAKSDAITGQIAGLFPADWIKEWLRNRDLGHIFQGRDSSIEW